MNGSQHISQEDLALYSMQALTPEENAAIKSHLDACPTCRTALADVLGDVSVIGLAVPQQELPSGARQRFIAALASMPQSSGFQSAPSFPAVPEPDPRPASFPWLRWLGWLVAIAALVLAVFLGYRDSLLERRLNESGLQIAQLSAQTQKLAPASHKLQMLMNALTSPQSKHITLTETRRPAAAAVQVTYLPQSGALILVASNLHPLPANKTYELWLIPFNGKVPIAAALFRPDNVGNASVIMPPMPAGLQAKAFGVTVEMASGSTTPTLPIVMTGS